MQHVNNRLLACTIIREEPNMFTLVGKYRKITINDSLVENYRKHVNFLLKEFGYSS